MKFSVINILTEQTNCIPLVNICDHLTKSDFY